MNRIDNQPTIIRFTELATEAEYFLSDFVENWLNDFSGWIKGGAQSFKRDLLDLSNELRETIDTVEPIIVQSDPGASVCEVSVFHKPEDGDDHFRAMFAERPIIESTACAAAVEAITEIARSLCDHNPADFGRGFGAAVFTSLKPDLIECRRLSARVKRERMLVEAYAGLAHAKVSYSMSELCGKCGVSDGRALHKHLDALAIKRPGRGEHQWKIKRTDAINVIALHAENATVKAQREIAQASLVEIQDAI